MVKKVIKTSKSSYCKTYVQISSKFLRHESVLIQNIVKQYREPYYVATPDYKMLIVMNYSWL